MNTPFLNRTDAGAQLAEALRSFKGRVDTIVLALPRGGVPVAYEVAQKLSLPLDIWLVRKLGVPQQEEIAMGAIAYGGIIVLNDHVLRLFNIQQDDIESITNKEQQELARRNRLYRHDRYAPDISGKTVIVIDDGLATGATMKAAVQSLRRAGAVWIVAAVPVGPAPICADVAHDADEVICLAQPEPFYGVGQWYGDFSQILDEEVTSLLKRTMTLPPTVNPELERKIS